MLIEMVASGLILLFKYFQPITLQKLKTKDHNIINPILIPMFNKSNSKQIALLYWLRYTRTICPGGDQRSPTGYAPQLISSSPEEIQSFISVDFYCWPKCRDYMAHSDDLKVYFQPLQCWVKKGKKYEISTDYLDITDCRVCDFHFFFSPLTSQKSKRAPRVVHLDVDLMKKSTALENIVTKQQTTACKLVPVTQCRYSQLLLRSSRKVSIYSLQVSITKECPTLPL